MGTKKIPTNGRTMIRASMFNTLCMAHRGGRLNEVFAQLESGIRAETIGERLETMLRDLNASMKKLREKYQIEETTEQNQEKNHA